MDMSAENMREKHENTQKNTRKYIYHIRSEPDFLAEEVVLGR